MELKPLLNKLKRDAKETRKRIRFLEREQLRARTAIYSALRHYSHVSPLSEILKLSKTEAEHLFGEDLKLEEKKLESIEQHIEELTEPSSGQTKETSTASENLTEEQIISLGFTLTKEYRHDGFRTRRYSKGPLEVEFSYASDSSLNTVDLAMQEVIVEGFTFDELRTLASLLGGLEE